MIKFNLYLVRGYRSDYQNGGKLIDVLEIENEYDIEIKLSEYAENYGKQFGLGQYGILAILEEQRKYIIDYGSYSYFLVAVRK